LLKYCQYGIGAGRRPLPGISAPTYSILATPALIDIILCFYQRTNIKLTPTQDNYLNTSIYRPLAEIRRK